MLPLRKSKLLLDEEAQDVRQHRRRQIKELHHGVQKWSESGGQHTCENHLVEARIEPRRTVGPSGLLAKARYCHSTIKARWPELRLDHRPNYCQQFAQACRPPLFRSLEVWLAVAQCLPLEPCQGLRPNSESCTGRDKCESLKEGTTLDSRAGNCHQAFRKPCPLPTYAPLSFRW